MKKKRQIFELIPDGFFHVITIEELWYEEFKVLTRNWVKKKKKTDHELNRKGLGCLNALVMGKKTKNKKKNQQHQPITQMVVPQRNWFALDRRCG